MDEKIDDDEDLDDDDDLESRKGKKKGKKLDDSRRRDSNASDKSEEGDTKRTNQFSFVERATQTMNNALKVKMRMMTWSGLDYSEPCRAATCRQNLHPGQTSVRLSTSGSSTTGKSTIGNSNFNIL